MKLRRAIFFFRNPLAGLPVLLAFLASLYWGSAVRTEPLSALSTLSATSITLLAGFGLAAAGVALRAWSACHNSYGRRRPKTLAVTGPYSVFRNPLYVGSAAIIAGAVLASGIPFALPAGVASFLWSILIYDVVVQHEEERLEERYGAPYLEYKSKVSRWLPQRPSDLSIGGEPSQFLLEIFSELPAFLVFAPWVALRLAH